MRALLITVMTMAFLPLATVAQSETTVEYWTRQGYSSNLLESPDPLSGPFWEGSLKLRGTIGQDDAKLSYAIYQEELRTGSYRFGDTHETGFNLRYTHQLRKDTVIELEGSYIRNSSGDVFLQLPGNIIGYRAVDRAVQVFAAAYKHDITIGMPAERRQASLRQARGSARKRDCVRTDRA
jgi:hypothetical protein